MGSAGHAFVAHTKALSPRANAATGGWGAIPHPLDVVAGQRFWPRYGRNRVVFGIRRVCGPTAHARQLGSPRRSFTVRVDRLLAVDRHGRGRHYRFGGYTSRRYVTQAIVMGFDGRDAVLCLPAWHPARPIRLRRELLPAVESKTVLRCSADLSAASAGRLELANLRAEPCPSAHHPAAFEFISPVVDGGRPSVGEGCGDIVYELTEDLAMATRNGPWFELHCPRRPTGLARGDRVYLAESAGAPIRRYLQLEALVNLPSGLLLRCDAHPLPVHGPPAGEHLLQHRWRWRWWPRCD